MPNYWKSLSVNTGRNAFASIIDQCLQLVAHFEKNDALKIADSRPNSWVSFSRIILANANTGRNALASRKYAKTLI